MAPRREPPGISVGQDGVPDSIRSASHRYSEAVVIDQAIRRLVPIAAGYEDITLMVVYGSRARGDHHARSDWDIGYLSSTPVDILALLDDVTHTLGTDAVDMVDLDRASGLLRFQAARDGVVVYEAEPQTFESFAVAAALYWCDVEPVIRRAHTAILAGLG